LGTIAHHSRRPTTWTLKLVPAAYFPYIISALFTALTGLVGWVVRKLFKAAAAELKTGKDSLTKLNTEIVLQRTNHLHHIEENKDRDAVGVHDQRTGRDERLPQICRGDREEVEIIHLVHAQVALLGEGFLIRGALILGEIERSYGVLFGPGLISAYELEREQAQFPRIVVDPKLIEAVKTNPLLRSHDYEEEMEYISRFIKRDDDGAIFIDYLGGMQDEVAEFGEETALKRLS
jgi:hypothetical protein